MQSTRDGIKQSIVLERRIMMFNTNFDTLYQLDGTIDVKILDKDVTPNQVLPIEDLWSLAVEWHLLKNAASTNPPGGVGGTWYLTVSLDSVGEGYEGKVNISGGVHPTVLEIGLANNLISSTSTDYGWKATIDVTAAEMARLRSLPPPDNLIPGNYRASVLITYKNDIGVTLPMAAAFETDLITFFEST
jgi:hypothetical protein